MDPEIEEKVLVLLVPPRERLAGQMIHPVHVGAPAQGPALQRDRPKMALLVQWHAAMEHEVVVHDAVQRAVTEEEPHVLLEAVAVAEVMPPFFDNFPLFRRQRVRIVRVKRGKIGRIQRICPRRKPDRPGDRIDFVEQQPVIHVPLGVAQDSLPFQFEEDDIDGLDQRLLAFPVIVELIGEHDKIPQGDTVPVLQDLPVVIAHVIADNIDDTGLAARRGAHPQDVVVPPLQV